MTGRKTAVLGFVVAVFVLAGFVFVVTTKERIGTETVSVGAGSIPDKASGLSIEEESASRRSESKGHPRRSSTEAVRQEFQRPPAPIPQKVVEEEFNYVDEEFQDYLAGIAQASPATLQKEALENPDAEVREVAIFQLSKRVYLPDSSEPISSDQLSEVIDTLVETLRDDAESVRLASLDAFVNIHDNVLENKTTYAPLADAALNDSSEAVREMALQILVIYHGSEAMPVVQQAFQEDPSDDVINASKIIIEDFQAGEFDAEVESSEP